MSLTAVNAKEYVHNRIADGTYALLDKPGLGRGSSSWENFKIVVKRDTLVPIGYVQCQKETCKALLIYNGSTTGMIRHKCRDHTQSSSAPSTADKASIRDRCVLMCALDLIPFNIINSEGFLNLCQELINTGAKFGEVSAQDILPTPNTVYRLIQDMAHQVRASIVPKVKGAISKSQCAITCDFWMDNYRKTQYLTVTASYIEDGEESSEVRNSVLFTTRFPEDITTCDHIPLEIMYEQLADLQISPSDLRTVTFVSDKRDLGNHKRLPCVIHCINTAIRLILNDKFLCDEVPDIFQSIKTARKIVALLKRSGLIAKLENDVPQDNDGRWDSLYLMLDSFHSQRKHIENLLSGEIRHELASLYNSMIMECIIDFLKTFKEAIDDLESSKGPTLPFVVPWIFDLIDVCQGFKDHAVLTKFKVRAERIVREKILNEMHDLHYVATFLHPSFKELLALTDFKKKSVHHTVRLMLNNVVVSNLDDDSSPSAAKKFRKWSSPLGRREELERYINMDGPDGECKDLLSWWKTNAIAFPKLAKVAKEVFCIPASSAASGSNCYRAGLVVSERSYIDPDRVNDILIIHNNRKSIRTYFDEHC